MAVDIIDRTVPVVDPSTGRATQVLTTVFSQIRRAIDGQNKTPQIALTASGALTSSMADTDLVVNQAGAVTVDIPTDSATPFDIGTKIRFLRAGAGALTIDAATGVTLNGEDGASKSVTAQYNDATITKVGANAWVITGSYT